MSPLSLPYFLLPLWLAPAFVKLGEFVVAIVGMVAFLGRHGVSRGAGVVAGILFASSGFMMMWTNWPHTRVASFIPLLFWTLERLNQERRARDVVPVAAVVACMLLGGFPAVTIFTLTVAAAYVLARAWWRYRADAMAMLRVLGGSAGGVLLGVGLAAVQILPFIRNLDQLGLENRNFDGRHLPFALFVTTVAPDAVGLSVNGSDPRWYGPVNAIEAVGFVGAVAVVLAVAALVTAPTARSRAGTFTTLVPRRRRRGRRHGDLCRRTRAGGVAVPAVLLDELHRPSVVGVRLPRRRPGRDRPGASAALGRVPPRMRSGRTWRGARAAERCGCDRETVATDRPAVQRRTARDRRAQGRLQTTRQQPVRQLIS